VWNTVFLDFARYLSVRMAELMGKHISLKNSLGEL
jgi:hypothetical protein